ncbi:hypothetical protein GCM10009125_04790 [Castellaniella daejeonensis]|uniref:Uncharacterized protein n=1 Tax=Castellaniella daejeonensis TaxID=659013 RepID=A0ABN0TDC3_9BURK
MGRCFQAQALVKAGVLVGLPILPGLVLVQATGAFSPQPICVMLHDGVSYGEGRSCATGSIY